MGGALGSLGGETTNGGREEGLLPPLGTLGENTVSRTWPLEGKRASQEGGRGQGGKWSMQVTHLPGLSLQNFRDTGQTGPWTEGPTKASTRSYMHACSRGPHPTSCQPLSGNKHAGARTTLGRRQPSGHREEIRGPQTLCRDALAFVLTQKQLPQGPEPRPAAPRATPSSGEAHQRGTHRRLWTVCSDMKQSFRKERPVCWCFFGERVPVTSACAARTPPAACERAAGWGRLRQQGWSFLSEQIGSREERKQAEFSPREKPQAWQRLLQVLKSLRETPGGRHTTQAVGPPPHAGWLASGAPRPWARAPSRGRA